MEISKYQILGLYKYKNKFQVIDSLENIIHLQGTKKECQEYIKIYYENTNSK